MQPWRVVGITYELADGGQWLPVIRHEFYGASPELAVHVRARHLETDNFLRACESGAFGAVQCRTVWYEPERVL
ncbi:MAG: hypothetical protein ACRDNM_00125 [Gaiellaceae bacterium]